MMTIRHNLDAFQNPTVRLKRPQLRIHSDIRANMQTMSAIPSTIILPALCSGQVFAAVGNQSPLRSAWMLHARTFTSCNSSICFSPFFLFIIPSFFLHVPPTLCSRRSVFPRPTPICSNFMAQLSRSRCHFSSIVLGGGKAGREGDLVAGGGIRDKACIKTWHREEVGKRERER